MSKKFNNLSALDWDDTALIKAYDKGMSLRVKDLEPGTSKEEKRDSKKRNEWKVGDFCRAIYYADNLPYEAKIVSINNGNCTIEFLGYNEEVEVDLESLSKSHGKKARKKQIKNANSSVISADGSVSGDDMRNERSVSYSPAHTHSRRKHHRHGNRMFDQSADYTAAENSFHNVYPMVHYNEMSSTSMIPPAPPMPQCSEVAQNPSLCAMLTSWYMAGYYTGLHQAQKSQCQQHYCCRTTQNYCHH